MTLSDRSMQVVVDMVGVREYSLLSFCFPHFSPHNCFDFAEYNPRYFYQPKEFIPSRWYDTPPDSEAFSAFSVGPRACLGRKFATTEAVCFLTLLLRDWEVNPMLDVAKGETKEEWKRRVLDANVVLTLGVRDVPLRFVRRKH